MEDQKPNEESEPNVQSGEIKQEAEQSPKPRRRDKLPSLDVFLKLLGAYLLFLPAIGSVGVLGFYSHHDTVLTVTLIVSVILVVIVPISVIGYALIRFGNTSTEKSESRKRLSLDRLTNSFVGRFLLSLSNSLTFTLFNYALLVYQIVRAITRFPLEPRASLAIIVLFLALLFGTIIAEAYRSLGTRFRRIDRRIDGDVPDAIKATTDNVTLIVEALKNTNESITLLKDGLRNVNAKSSDAMRLIADIKSSYAETHKTTLDALESIQQKIRILTNAERPAIDERLEGYEERESD